ncbi:MAG: hypothetical protein ACPGVK_11640 [Halocynthiibacter sp.]
MGVDELPADHYAVFKNITKYRFVDQWSVYKRLGSLGPIQRGKHTIEGFTVPYREMPKQLCSPEDFRAKICGGDPSKPSLVQKNALPHGVPQGAPISDLIVNFYLIDFDAKLDQYARERGGKYMRYSDDILLIIPGGDVAAAAAFATDEIKKHGEAL